MGKMRMGILDGFVGKVGTVVGSFWKGKKVIRGYNEFPSNPDTEAQRLQREKFGILGEMGGAMLTALQMGLKSVADGHVSTEVGEFVRLNMKNVSGTVGNMEVDYEKLQLSVGKLTQVSLGECDFNTPLTVSVPIDDSCLGPNAKESDKLYLVVYSKTCGRAVLSDGSATRVSEEVSVRVPGYWQGHHVEVYAFLTDADGTDSDEGCSDTLYCGSGRIA